MSLINRISCKKIIIDFFVILIFSAVFNTIWSWGGTGSEIYHEDIDEFDYYLPLFLSQFIGFLWAYDRHPSNRLGHLTGIAIVTSVIPIIAYTIIIFDIRTLVFAMGTIYVPLFAAYGLQKYCIYRH